MRCIPALTSCCDRPFWVTRDSFYRYFDQGDFCCRESEFVVPSYLAEWFHTPEDGIARFKLPAFTFVAGNTQFINGRHRTAVLLQQRLDPVPIAFVVSDDDQKSALELLILDNWNLRPLDLQVAIDLPDLPVMKRLP